MCDITTHQYLYNSQQNRRFFTKHLIYNLLRKVFRRAKRDGLLLDEILAKVDFLVERVNIMDAEIRAAIDGVKTAVSEEAADIAQKVEDLKTSINNGLGKTEILAELDSITTSVRNLSDSVVVPEGEPTEGEGETPIP